MITIRYYKPGRVTTLYHYRQDKLFKGVMYINLAEVTEDTTNLMLRLSRIFLGLSVIGFIWVFFPPFYSAATHNLTVLAKSIAPSPKPQQIIPAVANIPINEEFYMEIPKINLISTIIPNVDSSNEEQYMEKLKSGVAHAKGSYFPGDSGPIVLFSHSTDTLAHIVQYNAKFYALKDLDVGDSITIHFKGKVYNYMVKDKKIISPTDLNAIRQTDSKLILTTCWPPGTDWQRLIVFAK